MTSWYHRNLTAKNAKFAKIIAAMLCVLCELCGDFILAGSWMKPQKVLDITVNMYVVISFWNHYTSRLLYDFLLVIMIIYLNYTAYIGQKR